MSSIKFCNQRLKYPHSNDRSVSRFEIEQELPTPMAETPFLGKIDRQKR
ncbi:hypothetical protein [Tychonema sp. LEGE 07203]|nr:hypothetical protein [Tychonema sp. LEGE 07203]MBE9094498.1 hypothetical protein [Tychonema sp. LEGE 07203]